MPLRRLTWERYPLLLLTPWTNWDARPPSPLLLHRGAAGRLTADTGTRDHGVLGLSMGLSISINDQHLIKDAKG